MADFFTRGWIYPLNQLEAVSSTTPPEKTTQNVLVIQNKIWQLLFFKMDDPTKIMTTEVNESNVQ